MSGRTQSMGLQQAESRTANCLGNANPAATHADSELQWPIYTLGDLIDRGDAELQTGPFGTMLHAKAYTKVGTPVVAVKNIGDNRLVDDEIPRVDQETALRLERYRLVSGDIVFGRKGAVDRRALVKPEEEGWLQGSDCIRLRLNQNRIQPRFISFVLGSATHRAWFNQQAHGATMPSLNQEILSRLPLPIPPYEEQEIVAGVLGALDDKIELNRKMNETLEAMARALFKSWFVDFDPVRAKAEGRDTGLPEHFAALFPDSFENSELGEIPAGWRYAPLPEVIEINPSRSLRKGDVAPYLDMANMPTSGHSAAEVIERPFGSGMRFINGDTLVARITPCLENGKTAFVDFLQEDQIGWGSTEFIVLRPRPPLPEEFAYCLARSPEFREFAIQSMTGSSGRQRVPAESLSHFKVALPAQPIAEQFGNFIRPLFARAGEASRESQTLAALRDTLLPKLISGEIQVNGLIGAQEERFRHA